MHSFPPTIAPRATTVTVGGSQKTGRSRAWASKPKQTTAPIARAERTRKGQRILPFRSNTGGSELYGRSTFVSALIGRSVLINLSTIVYDSAGVHSDVVRLARTASSSGSALRADCCGSPSPDTLLHQSNGLT
jgi:hypothetical protein